METLPASTRAYVRNMVTSLLPVLVILLLSESTEVHAKGDGHPSGHAASDPEYCWQAFNATCPAGQVILMERAVYGRMRLGRCLTRDYYVGCSADVLHYADRRCSGRRQCDFPIPDTSLQQLQPCPKDLMAYLEASYLCVKVSNHDKRKCQGDLGTRRLVSPGYLASVTASEKEALVTNSCPWRITVQPGQRINLTLYDFNIVPAASTSAGGAPHSGGGGGTRDAAGTVCQVYAIIKEKGSSTDVTVCGGDQRQRMVYLSESNIIDIQVMTITDEHQHGHFLLKYEAVGCADMTAPKGGWIRRRGDRLTIACNGTGETRHLVCSGTRWIGEIRNCSSSGSTAVAELISNDNDFPFGLIIAIVIGVLLGVILGVLLLATVTCCQRRLHRNRPGRNNIFLISASKGSAARRVAAEKAAPGGTVVRTSDYGYAHVWELQHLRGSPDCQPDLTKENQAPSTGCNTVDKPSGAGNGGGSVSGNVVEPRLHYDQRTGTLTACRNNHLYESPHGQAAIGSLTAADIVLGHDGIPYQFHEFEGELPELTTFTAPPSCIADNHDCIHMTMSDNKL